MSAVEKILKKYTNRLSEERRKKSKKIPGAKTDGQVKAELEMELKALLAKWKKAQAEKDPKKKEEEESKDDKHSYGGKGLSAVLWRNGSYNKNMHKYMSKTSSRAKAFKMDAQRKSRLDDYYTFEPFINHFMTSYGFGEGSGARPENFNPGATISEAKAKKKGKKSTTAGNSFPYKWNGHHMIPCGAFYQGQKKKGKSKGMITSIFTDDQYALLLMSDFNVNHGQNVIPLPDKLRFYQPIHDMILHPSDHDEYTKMVQKEMKNVAKGLEELSGKADEPHPDVSVEIAAELASFEDTLWKKFIKWGKEEVNALVEKRPPEERDFIKNGGLC